MSEFDEWKNLMKKLKKFTKDECKLMNKSDLIKYLLIWQECAHQALDIITSQDDIFSLLGLEEFFEDDNKQYILFTNSKNSDKFQNIKNNKLLIKFSKEYFGHNNTYTINDFDKLCRDTREQLQNKINFEDTELYKILNELKNEVIFIWTGSEFNLSGQVEGFENLINNIHRNIIDKNIKINLSYYKEKRK